MFLKTIYGYLEYKSFNEPHDFNISDFFFQIVKLTSNVKKTNEISNVDTSKTKKKKKIKKFSKR